MLPMLPTPQRYVDEHRKASKPRKKPKKVPAFVRRISRGNSNHKYDIRLRHTHELPPPAADLIACLMKEDTEERLSVREAQEHEWVGGYEHLPHGDVPSRPEDPTVFVTDEAAHI